MTDSIGTAGKNLTKVQQAMHSYSLLKGLVAMIGDWNMPPDTLLDHTQAQPTLPAGPAWKPLRGSTRTARWVKHQKKTKPAREKGPSLQR